MGLNDPQDVLAASLAAAEELKIRKLIACAYRAAKRTRQLIRGSRTLIDTERKLMVQWRSRRPRVRALLAHRGPRPLRKRSSAAAPVPSFSLPKAA